MHADVIAAGVTFFPGEPTTGRPGERADQPGDEDDFDDEDEEEDEDDEDEEEDEGDGGEKWYVGELSPF